MGAPQFYIRFEEWAQAGSRSGFALLGGVGSAVGLLVVSPLFDDIGILNAVSLGIMMTVAYYAFDPLNKG
ncbi:hypothetical protein ACFQDG_09820 [Natronoarchaeum mannanilyticum]|uniref:Cytosine permease n=1 Tax=Natronoarchaeum mannanilyticum TaxID=926360 RepID=A0AAV3T9R7_9EURY